MYNIRPTSKFQKDLKRAKRRGYDISLLTAVIKKLAAGEPLPAKHRDHELFGDYTGCRECHIRLLNSSTVWEVLFSRPCGKNKNATPQPAKSSIVG